jgi:predicted thioesterase
MATAHVDHTVTEADTASVLGSGDLPVLATPRLINWLERVAHSTARSVIRDGQSTVGTLVHIEHLKATPVGRVVTCSASKPISDGRRLIFHVQATDDQGEEVARGEIHRRVVESEQFMSRFAVGAPESAAPAPPSAE